MNKKTSSVPLPGGFLCSGMICGIKEDKSRKDLGLIVAEKDALLGAVYTKNRFPSAHVTYCRKLTPSNKFRALIVNSGNANAATGQKGIQANLQMATTLANKLGVLPQQVFTSSTGIIGRPFPDKTIIGSMDELIKQLKPDCDSVSEAIMTTDTRPKRATESVTIDGSIYTVSGFAKGSGMIHPQMATMLAYILTDAPLMFSEIQSLTTRISDKSFNCVSVDGDTSTNDSFYLIGSNPVESVSSDNRLLIEDAITKVAIKLAKQIAADGEGAEHLIEVTVGGAPAPEVCRRVMYAVINSNLVKTAVHGRDPNWGRLMMAAGNGLAGSTLQPNSALSITIQDIPVLVKGEPAAFDESALSAAMGAEIVEIKLDLHAGTHSITGWGCDLSTEYIHINADYTT